MTTESGRCRCGHDLAAHSGSGVAGVPCKVCGVPWRQGWTMNCRGWDPQPTQGGDAHGSAVLPREYGDGSGAGPHVTGPAVATHPTGPTAGPPAGVWEEVEGALSRLGPGALSPEAQQQVERVMAGPPDLHQAIQAATNALRDAKVITSEHWTRHLAEVAVEAAWPYALQAATEQLRRSPIDQQSGGEHDG